MLNVRKPEKVSRKRKKTERIIDLFIRGKARKLRGVANRRKDAWKD